MLFYFFDLPKSAIHMTKYIDVGLMNIRPVGCTITSLLTGVMTMGASRPPHVIESFQQLQDLANVIDNVDRAGERHVVATNEHYWLCRPSTRGPDYLLSWSETTLAFSATEFNNLRDLVSNLFSHPDIQVGLKRMRTLFGDA